MIPVRTYQDERQLAWGNIIIFQNQLFIAEGGFDPPTYGLWAQHASSTSLCLINHGYM